MPASNSAIRVDCDCGYRRLARFWWDPPSSSVGDGFESPGRWKIRGDHHVPVRNSYTTTERAEHGRLMVAMNHPAAHGSAVRFECPAPRCRQTHIRTRANLASALERAVESGRVVVVLGVDL
jgi:hypothetical protein